VNAAESVYVGDQYRRKVFTNLEDDLEDQREELSQRFQDADVQVIGCMALFSAR